MGDEYPADLGNNINEKNQNGTGNFALLCVHDLISGTSSDMNAINAKVKDAELTV